MDFQGYLSISLLAFLAGLASRPNLEQIWNRLLPKGRPLRPVPMRFNTVTPAVTVEPVHRLPMWITRTHAYIVRGELCRRTPFNVREMRELTGLSSRQQKKYMDVLQQGRVVAVIPSGGVRWLVGKRDRRRLLTRLPYPRELDPPDFSPVCAVTVATRRNGTEKGETA